MACSAGAAQPPSARTCWEGWFLRRGAPAAFGVAAARRKRRDKRRRRDGNCLGRPPVGVAATTGEPPPRPGARRGASASPRSLRGGRGRSLYPNRAEITIPSLRITVSHVSEPGHKCPDTASPLLLRMGEIIEGWGGGSHLPPRSATSRRGWRTARVLRRASGGPFAWAFLWRSGTRSPDTCSRVPAAPGFHSKPAGCCREEGDGR